METTTYNYMEMRQQDCSREQILEQIWSRSDPAQKEKTAS